jgi:hypothetical protein
MILSWEEIYEAFLYIGCVNDTVAVFCLLACALSFIEADDQQSEARSCGQACHFATPAMKLVLF